MDVEKVPEIKIAPAGRPWCSIGISLCAFLVWIFPASQKGFLYDRALIAGGQWWRIWSGHLAHHGGSHLLWNLAVFLPAGIWLERRYPFCARWFFAIAPLCVSLALLVFEPALGFYAGLSGVTVGVVTLLGCLQLRNPGEPKWFWSAVLISIAVKVAAEFMGHGSPFFAALPPGIRNVPLAHLAGAGCSVIFFLIWTTKNARRNPLSETSGGQ